MPLGRRFGRPGLIGTAARTAVIAGTAQATAGAVQRRQTARAQQTWEEQQRAAEQEQVRAQAAAEQAVAQYAHPPVPGATPAAAPAATPAAGTDLLAQLDRIAQLRASGALDDREFTAAKARLLG